MTEISEREAVAYIAGLAEAERDGTAEKTDIRIGPYAAFVLIAGLQLAMRHPDMSEAQLDVLRQIIDQMASLFAGTPGEQLLALGNDPASDVPHGCQYPTGPHAPECPPGPHRGFRQEQHDD